MEHFKKAFAITLGIMAALLVSGIVGLTLFGMILSGFA